MHSLPHDSAHLNHPNNDDSELKLTLELYEKLS
jgi:hypothetical protein